MPELIKNPYDGVVVKIRNNFGVKKEHDVRSWETIIASNEVRSALNKWQYQEPQPISDYQYGYWYDRGSEDAIKGYHSLFRKIGDVYSADGETGQDWTAYEEHQIGFAYTQGYYSETSAKRDGLG